MKKDRRITIAGIALFILLLCVSLSIVISYKSNRLEKDYPREMKNQYQTNEQLSLNNSVSFPQGVDIRVRVADTDFTRTLGLSGFSKLPEGVGMWFSFPEMGIYPFWMKDMNFPPDIIWIDNNFRIIDIVRSVSPETFPKTFVPQRPAQYVLEVNGGFSDQYKINIRDQVVFQ